MILFITTMLIWWCIHFAHYYLGKLIITGISEEKLVEIMSTPLFYHHNQRKSKKLERYAFIPILLIYVPIVWLYTLLFKEIQAIILPSEGIIYTDGFVVLPAIFVGIGTLVYLIFRIAAHQESIPKEKWIAQPTFKECKKRIANLKRIGIRWSLFSQFLFVMTMLFYTHIGDNGVTNSGFFDLSAINRPYSAIEKVKTSISIKDVTKDGAASHDYHYFYTIKFDDDKVIELWDPFGWNQKKVEKLKLTTHYFRENSVPVVVSYPSFLDWTRYKKILSTKRYQQLKNYFDAVRDLSENLAAKIPMGKSITIDSVDYRIDSVTVDPENGIFRASSNKTYLFIHMTAHNENTDSFYVSPFDLEIHDRLDSAYRHSIFVNDTFKNKIPPKKTESGSFGFYIPKDIPLPLNLRYQDGFLDKRYYWFELMDSTKIHLLK